MAYKDVRDREMFLIREGQGFGFKPCPFCGGKDFFYIAYHSGRGSEVRCRKCNGNIWYSNGFKEPRIKQFMNIREKWNRRESN